MAKRKSKKKRQRVDLYLWDYPLRRVVKGGLEPRTHKAWAWLDREIGITQRDIDSGVIILGHHEAQVVYYEMRRAGFKVAYAGTV